MLQHVIARDIYKYSFYTCYFTISLMEFNYYKADLETYVVINTSPWIMRQTYHNDRQNFNF